MNIFRYLVAFVSVALVAGCGNGAAPSSAPTPAASNNGEPTQAQPKLRTMKIYVGPEVLDTELALTPQQERTGMMFRTNIQDSDSMLFVLLAPQQASFWMTNCPVSISVAYITVDGTIAEIHHLQHDDARPVYSTRNDIEFALETQEGWFIRHHIAVGTVIRTEKGTLADTFLRR